MDDLDPSLTLSTNISDWIRLHGYPTLSTTTPELDLSYTANASWVQCNFRCQNLTEPCSTNPTNATRDSDVTCVSDDVTFVGRYIMAGAVGVIATFGGINNLMILIVAMGSPLLRRKTHLLVMNLALIDFLVTAVFCPLYVLSLLLDVWPFSNTICALTSLILSHNSGVSLLTNFAIAINRCLLAKGGGQVRLTQTRPIFLGIVFIWIAVFSVNVIPVLSGFVQLEYSPQYAYCAPSMTLTPFTHWVVFYSYTYAIVLLGPFLGSIIAYFLVFRSVRGSMLLTRSEYARRRYIRTSRNLIYLFIAFCICWLPDTIHFTIDPYGVHIPVYLSRLFVVLFLSNSALNPFIFAWKFPAFRKSLRFCLLLRVIRRRGSMPSATRSTFSAGNLSPTPSPNPPTHTMSSTPLNVTSVVTSC